MRIRNLLIALLLFLSVGALLNMVVLNLHRFCPDYLDFHTGIHFPGMELDAFCVFLLRDTDSDNNFVETCWRNVP